MIMAVNTSIVLAVCPALLGALHIYSLISGDPDNCAPSVISSCVVLMMHQYVGCSVSEKKRMQVAREWWSQRIAIINSKQLNRIQRFLFFFCRWSHEALHLLQWKTLIRPTSGPAFALFSTGRYEQRLPTPPPLTFQDDPGWFCGVKQHMRDREVSAAQPRKLGIGQWLPVITGAGWLPRWLALWQWVLGRWAGRQLCLALQPHPTADHQPVHGTASECSAWKVRGLWVHWGGDVTVRKIVI